MAEQEAPSSGPEPTKTDSPAAVSAPASVPSASTEPAHAPAAEASVEPAAATAPAAATSVASEPAASATDPAATTATIDPAAIDDILKQASFEGVAEAMASTGPDAAGAAAASAEELKLPDFSQVMQEAQVSSIDLLRDVDLNVKIELGRSRMLVEDVLKLGEGSVVELDKLAGDPVDVFVNERLIARGEVLVLNDNFCVRINEILAGVKEEGL